MKNNTFLTKLALAILLIITLPIKAEKSYIFNIHDDCHSIVRTGIFDDIEGGNSSTRVLCSSTDCKAIVEGNIRLCGTSDCRAILSSLLQSAPAVDFDDSISQDARALIDRDISLCKSQKCRAYLRGDVTMCYPKSCMSQKGKKICLASTLLAIAGSSLVGLMFAVT